jgi:hypothetical protein
MAFVFWQTFFIEIATLLTPHCHWTLLVLVPVVQPYIPIYKIPESQNETNLTVSTKAV